MRLLTRVYGITLLVTVYVVCQHQKVQRALLQPRLP